MAAFDPKPAALPPVKAPLTPLPVDYHPEGVMHPVPSIDAYDTA
jgi:hypothetical protein